MKTPLRILMADEDVGCCLLIRRMMSHIPAAGYVLDWSGRYDEALEQALTQRHDLYLVGGFEGRRSGLDLTLELLRHRRQTPVVLLIDAGAEGMGAEAIGCGAADFLNKQELSPSLLERSIRYSLERSRAQQRIHQLSHYDPVTGLPNRVQFRERLKQAMTQAVGSGGRAALMLLDLDNFKLINDSLGHDAGDRVLKTLARRMRACLRPCDTLSRWGGDEFALCLPDIGEPEGAARTARQILQTMEKPIPMGEQDLYPRASIGISLLPDDGDKISLLFKQADMAMHQAKAQGRNTYRFFFEEMTVEVLERLSIESRLRTAIKKGQFELHYQLQFDRDLNDISGVEALLRWKDPLLGDVPPDRFIPIAEETGLILPLGKWVLRTACNQVRAWMEDGLGAIKVAVNISGVQLRDPGLFRAVSDILEETGLPPALLEIELTEGTVMENAIETIKTLFALKSLGVGLSIDDFGTGYSSLSYLKRFPVDVLKIDRSFVQELPANGDDKAIVSAIAAMAQSLNLKIIAEGVENRDQVNFLLSRGCVTFQGFLFGRPTPSHSIQSSRERAKTLKMHGAALS